MSPRDSYSDARKPRGGSGTVSEHARRTLPPYRQSQIFDRDGIDLERSTLADWVGNSTALLEPLADAIGRHVLNGQAIFADDTPVKMQAPGSGKCKTARFWTYARDERPWAGDASPAAWYQFSVDRKGIRTIGHLKDCTGWMHADGYAGFEELYRSGRIHEVACMAHIRRKFVDVQQSQGSAIAEEAIRRIAELYAVEKQARGSPPDERVRLRQAKAKQVLDDPDTWPGAQLTRISGKTPLAQAIRYAITRIKRLRPCLDHGFLEIDTDVVEQPLSQIFWVFGGFSRHASTILGAPARNSNLRIFIATNAGRAHW